MILHIYTLGLWLAVVGLVVDVSGGGDVDRVSLAVDPENGAVHQRGEAAPIVDEMSSHF